MNDQNKIKDGPAEDSPRRSAALIRQYHQIYNRVDLIRAIQHLKGVGRLATDGNAEVPSDKEAWHVEADTASLTSEDTNRLRVLERIAADPRGHRRRSIVGSHGMVSRLRALAIAIPHFAAAIDVVTRAALLSARTATPLRLPPMLLLGEPGIGKSYTLRRLAEAIGADFSLIAANLTDAFRLRGLNTAWRGARMGRIAEIMLSASTTPIVLVDEFDKAIGDRTERPFDIWHSLLERENAESFKDDFLEIELRADHIIWFASANDLSAIPNSILDRLLVIEIAKPNHDQLGIIIAGIYAACRSTYGGKLPDSLSEDALRELLHHNPRRISRLLDLAVGYAVADSRWCLSTNDIRRAEQLVGAAHTDRMSFRGPVGFLRGKSP